MSRNPLLDLSQYQEPNMQGPMAAIALKARENLMRQQQAQSQMQAPRIGNAPPQQSPQAPGQPIDPKRAQWNVEINRMFTPVEKGGALITSETPPQFQPQGAIPDGYGWIDIPKSMRDKMKLKPGVSYIGFHPGRMTETQANTLTYWNQQRDAERQAEADAEQKAALASNPQQNQ